jgi:bla regulator protein BlaR1
MEYFIKASALLTLFFLFYKLLLQKETFFQLNRIFLLVGLMSAVILPLIVILRCFEIPAPNFTNLDFIAATTTIVSENSFDWYQISPFLYLIGVILFSFKLLISISSLLKLILKSAKV